MATDKYGLHTIDYSVQGWDAIMTTDMEKLDDVIHTHIAGIAGETIAQYDAVYLESDGKYDMAQADGSQQPAVGLIVASAVLDDDILIQRVGPITNTNWTWATDSADEPIGSKVYLDPSTPGALTDSKPGSDAQMIGFILSTTSILIWVANMEGGEGYLENIVEDVTPELGGQLQVHEYDIKLDSLLSPNSANITYSGITCDGTLGATLAVADLVYLNTADQRWELVDADTEATSGDVMLAIVLEAGNDGDTSLLLLQGFVRDDDWNFTSYGQALFAGLTSGDMVQDISGFTTGDIVRVVGYASTIADQIYFNPSNVWFEIA